MLSEAETSPSAPKRKRKSSAVTSGRKLFVEGDGRSPWSRRYRDLIAGHVSDLGGPEALSEAQMSLVRRASAIECELEQMEGKLSQGEEIDLDVFTRSASHLRRILETLGIQRVARDITQDLQTYFASKRTQEASKASPSGPTIDAEPSS